MLDRGPLNLQFRFKGRRKEAEREGLRGGYRGDRGGRGLGA